MISQKLIKPSMPVGWGMQKWIQIKIMILRDISNPKSKGRMGNVMFVRLVTILIYAFSPAIDVLAQSSTTIPSDRKTTVTNTMSSDPNVKKLYEMTIMISGGKSQNELSPLGTGFFFTENGDILTAAHVILDPATKQPFKAFSIQWEKTRAQAMLIQPGPFNLTSLSGVLSYDVAVLKVQLTGGKTPFLPLGDSTRVEIGDEILSTGYPLGGDLLVDQDIFRAPTFSKSINPFLAKRSVGQCNYQILGDMTIDNFMYLDGTGIPGMSGGPIFDVRTKELVGIQCAVKVQQSNGTPYIYYPISSITPLNYVKFQLQNMGLIQKDASYQTIKKVIN